MLFQVDLYDFFNQRGQTERNIRVFHNSFEPLR